MILGKVISRVVSSAKLRALAERQLLLVKPEPGFLDGQPVIAIDTVQAGPGDLVLVMQEGTGARQCVNPDNPSEPLPAQMVIVGVVDSVSLVDCRVRE